MADSLIGSTTFLDIGAWIRDDAHRQRSLSAPSWDLGDSPRIFHPPICAYRLSLGIDTGDPHARGTTWRPGQGPLYWQARRWYDPGTTFDTSLQREPLEFTVGGGDLILGFEQAVLGMAPGESRTTTIPSDQAYGPYHPERVMDVERHHLPPDLQPEIGQRLHMTRQDGSRLTVMVTAVTEVQVTLDANHPLAGQDLIFDITLVEIM